MIVVGVQNEEEEEEEDVHIHVHPPAFIIFVTYMSCTQCMH